MFAVFRIWIDKKTGSCNVPYICGSVGTKLKYRWKGRISNFLESKDQNLIIWSKLFSSSGTC